MMNLDIQRLSDENRHLIDGFSCVETEEMLAGLNAKERRRIRKHSQYMEIFSHWIAMNIGSGIKRGSAYSGIFTIRLCWIMTLL